MLMMANGPEKALYIFTLLLLRHMVEFAHNISSHTSSGADQDTWRPVLERSDLHELPLRGVVQLSVEHTL